MARLILRLYRIEAEQVELAITNSNESANVTGDPSANYTKAAEKNNSGSENSNSSANAT